MRCHGSRTQRDNAVTRGLVVPESQPILLSSTLSMPFTHPITDQAYSRFDPGAVTCSSCHAPHRGSSQLRAATSAAVGRRVSTRDPTQLEYELCQSCHGHAGVRTQSVTDISRLLNPGNRSYHPIEAPSMEGSASIRSALSGTEIDCTDCHGNSDPEGPAGPHGSRVQFLLRAAYTTVDGSPESASAYTLCYTCHEQEQVLDSPAFPEHRRHVVELRASCATCHNAHGSVANRSLIRFGEETIISGVSPSASTGRLAFVSDSAGSGTCYLTCHGWDHAPATYGGAIAPPEIMPWDPLPDRTRPRMRGKDPG
jgi:cytochrome c553